MQNFFVFLFTLESILLVGQGHAADKVDQLYLSPYREISLIASPEGYYPGKITIFEGEKVHFFVTAIGTMPNCFIINEKGVFLSALPGKVSEGETYFETPGMFIYRCPSTKIEGKLVVLPKRKKVERSVANIRGRGKVWRPKDAPDDWSNGESN